MHRKINHDLALQLRQFVQFLTGLAIFVLVINQGQSEEKGHPSRNEILVEVQDCLTRFPYRRRLASERAGVLASVPEEGDRFGPGDVVARLRDDVPRATLKVAEKRAGNDAEIRSARKAHELAAFSHEKMLRANKRRPGTFDADEVKRRELELANAALQVDVARHEFDVAQLELSRDRTELHSYEIRTDRAGIVTQVVKKDGEGVQASEEVLELVDTSTIRVEGFAAGTYLTVLRPGLTVDVYVRLPSPDGTFRELLFQGRLGYVDVSLTSGRELRVWADIENRQHVLVEGLLARMVIHAEVPVETSSAKQGADR